MTFYSVSAVIGYAAGYKRLKKYNNNNNNNNNNLSHSSYNVIFQEQLCVSVYTGCRFYELIRDDILGKNKDGTFSFW